MRHTNACREISGDKATVCKCTQRHTPTPWKVLPGTYNGDHKIVMDNKRWGNPHQGYVMTCGNDQQVNAAFIVRAVNAHEELLGALKEMVKIKPILKDKSTVYAYEQAYRALKNSEAK